MASEATQSAAPVHRFILLTDIVQSSRLSEQYGRTYLDALEGHNGLVERAVAVRGAVVYKQTGDGYLVLFETADACLDAALELGEALGQLEPLAEGEPLLVRLALHAGALQPSGREYFGPALNRVSRICQVCNPGQVLLSAAVAATLRDLPAGVALQDLGQHHLRDLASPEQLYQLESERFLRHDFPPLSTLDSRPNNLVEQPNAFIGRERELKELAKLLMEGKRLVSITAPGGYGKSRLGAQLCANLLHRFEHGVFMVYLAPVRESLEVPTAIAGALGYQFSAGRSPEQQLCDYLRTKELLLCLDNFEHVLESAPLVSQLLAAAPRLRIVATSREALRIEGENVYPLNPLPVGTTADEQYSEAVRLFADRAALVKHGYALCPDNAGQIQHFCEHLGGIPLAIELAAAWMDGFTLDELHDELTSQLELEARISGRPARHHSLKACLDWSWNLLGAEQQELLMKLSTFRGGFFSEAAAAVLGSKGMALRSAVLRLCDKSWLFTREVDGQTRFFLRDMLAHEYAFAKLEETRGPEDSLFEQAVRAHAAYFAALAESEGPRLAGGGKADGGKDQLKAFRTWRIELDNILEALDTALGRNEMPWLIAFAKYLQQFLVISGLYFIAQDRCSKILKAATELSHQELEALCRNAAGVIDWRIGEFESGKKNLEQSLKIFREIGDRTGEAKCLVNLGDVHNRLGDSARAAELLGQVLAICRDISCLPAESSALGNLANVRFKQGDYSSASELFEKALEIYRASGSLEGEAVVFGGQGLVCLKTGDLSRAAELLTQELAIYRKLGARRAEATSLANLAALYFAQLDFTLAVELQTQALSVFRENGERVGEAVSLSNLGAYCLAQGDASRSLELLSDALAMFQEFGERAGAAACLHNLAAVHESQGEYGPAVELLRQALTMRYEINQRDGICESLAASACLLADVGQIPAAAICLFGTSYHVAEQGFPFDPVDRRLIEKATALVEDPSSGLPPAEQQVLKSQAESMTINELAELALAELESLNAMLQNGEAKQESSV